MPGAMPLRPQALFELARIALGTTQVGLGASLGVARRTAQRWSDHGVPSYHLPDLARLVYPHDPALAAEVAAAAGTSLEALGIVQPPPPPAPAALPPTPPPPAPPPPPPDGVVDAVVCAASEAMGLMPGAVRPGLHAAFARALEIGLSVELVERALRAKLSPPPAPADGTPRDAPPAKRKATRV
jgi:hypothetical protein